MLALWESLPGFLIAMAVLSFGSGLLDVAPGAVVGDVVEGRAGPVFAAYSMSSDTANVVGPVAAGAIAEASYGDAFGLTAAVMAVAVGFGVAMPETKGMAQQRERESAVESGAQVGDEVVDVLDADRKADQVAGDLQRGARSAGMGHAAGVLDQRLDTTE